VPDSLRTGRLAGVTNARVSELTVAGATLRLVVERKRVKNVNARLTGTTLRVSAPFRMPESELQRAIEDLAGRLVRRVRAREVNAAADLLAVAGRVAARFPSPPALGEVRFSTNQRSRWGSCSPGGGAIVLNAALAHMPAWVLEAVLAHELAHLFFKDHGDAFRSLVRRVCPTSDRADGFLQGASWLAHRWESLPAVERAQLAGLTGE
jgi:predicted metal-dependent hydrolase